ncbi:LysE/ArgO family amino acid transporter [Rhizobium beringeri]
MSFSIYGTGLMMGLSLIVAIGAQNAFILRQGLCNEHLFAVCLACAVSDAALIVLGVTSLHQIARFMPWLDPVMRYGGALFLVWYGAKASIPPCGRPLLTTGEAKPSSFRQTLATCLALTWLNPHVYLDTVVLLGTISTRYPGQQASFAAGAVTGSFLFFFSLGYGAKRLRPIFSKPSSWRMLETLVAFTMWIIAFKLLSGM